MVVVQFESLDLFIILLCCFKKTCLHSIMQTIFENGTDSCIQTLCLGAYGSNHSLQSCLWCHNLS